MTTKLLTILLAAVTIVAFVGLAGVASADVNGTPIGQSDHPGTDGPMADRVPGETLGWMHAQLNGHEPGEHHGDGHHGEHHGEHHDRNHHGEHHDRNHHGEHHDRNHHGEHHDRNHHGEHHDRNHHGQSGTADAPGEYNESAPDRNNRTGGEYRGGHC